MQLHNSLSKFDVFSLNVRGIRDQIKRRSVLQETYSEPNDEEVWEKEWGGEVFFSHGTKHSKGVCILINPTAQIQVNYSYTDNSGRIVLITISLSGHKLTLCNIYAPNNQANQLQFMQELNNCIDLYHAAAILSPKRTKSFVIPPNSNTFPDWRTTCHVPLVKTQ